jgi:hypothetical protein
MSNKLGSISTQKTEVAGSPETPITTYNNMSKTRTFTAVKKAGLTITTGFGSQYQADVVHSSKNYNCDTMPLHTSYYL